MRVDLSYARAPSLNGRFDIDAASARVHRNPQDRTGWDHLIGALLAAGLPDPAMKACLAGLRAIPGDGRLLGRLARCHLESGHPAKVVEVARAALERSDLDVVSLTQLGMAAASCDQHHLADQAFERARRLAPTDPRLLFNLATSRRNLGDFAEAERLYDAVLTIDPDDWEALKNRSDLRTQSEERNHVGALREALGRCSADDQASALIHAALGKELEDLNQDAAAFAHFRAAARRRRRTFAYDVRADLARMEEIAANCARLRPSACTSSSPIFIVGLPRTGSTLLARMLARLAGVTLAGELQNFGIQTFRLASGLRAAQTSGAGLSTIAAASQVEPQRLGEAYLQSLTGLVDADSRFIDKLPNNFLYLGLIASALPKAAIIHVKRDPLDACFAIYKTQFKQAYPFSYSFDELAAYYAGYRRLMAHWRATLGPRLIEVSYEDLVERSEATLMSLCAAAGLQFGLEALDPSADVTPVSTASAAQVRRPIYSSSVGRWKRHRTELMPLARKLEDYGVLSKP